MKKSTITLEVELNEAKHPEQMTWQAQDSDQMAPQSCKAFLLSIYDKTSQDTLKIDLWTTDMQVTEMDKLMFHTLRSLADTYYRATNHKLLASAMQQFAHYFGEETGLLKKETDQLA